MLCKQHFVGHVQISGKFVHSELGHYFPQGLDFHSGQTGAEIDKLATKARTGQNPKEKITACVPDFMIS
jgi:hypothetical protein